MRSRLQIIYPTREGWRLTLSDGKGCQVLEVTDPELGDTLRQIRYAGEAVVLAVPSAWCLCARISASDLPRRGGRQVMIYRLEEKLPLNAEQVVVDFIEGAGTALGVACQLQPLSEAIEKLEQAGVRIDVVCPLALLAVGGLGKELVGVAVLAWFEEGCCDLVELSQEKPIGWSLLPQDPRQLKLALSIQAIHGSSEGRIVAVGADPSLLKQLEGMLQLQPLRAPLKSMLQAAMEVCPSILLGKQPPPINLRRDQAAAADPHRAIRMPLQAAMICCCLLLIVACATMLWQSRRYDSMAHRQQELQEKIFRQSIPNQSLPANVPMRLRSEEKRLRAVRGDAPQTVDQSSALLTLLEAMSRLPTDMRYRVLEIQASPQQIYLVGQARSHTDAELLAAALRQREGFVVDSPKTDRLATPGVEFRIHGNLHTSAPPSGDKP